MYLNLYNCGGHGKSLLMATKFNLGVNAPKKSHRAAFSYTNFRCKLANFFSFGHSRFSYHSFLFIYFSFLFVIRIRHLQVSGVYSQTLLTVQKSYKGRIRILAFTF